MILSSEAIIDSFDSRKVRPHYFFVEAIDDFLTEKLWIMGPWRLDDGQCRCAKLLSEALQAKPSMLTSGRFA